MAKKSIQDRIADIEGGMFPQNTEAAPSNGGGSVIVDETEPHPDIERIENLIKESVEELQAKETEFNAYVAEMQTVLDQKRKEVDESASDIRTRIVELVGIQKYLNNDI